MKKYDMGELVMAADSGKLYEAKIIKIQEIDDVCKYFIHYNGWARKYDTWIDDDLIAKKGETKAVEKLREHAKSVWVPEAKKSKGGTIKIGKNKQVVTQIEEARASTTETESNPTESSSSSTQKASHASEELQLDRKKIRKALLLLEVAEQEDCLFSSRIEIPFSLKTQLVDEWSLVSKEPRRLLKLPKESSITVRGIIEDFIELKLLKLGESDPVIDEYKELMTGLLIQFDKALSALLLYRQERDQYDALVAKHVNRSTVDIYGAEHLIRFFMRLPKLLTGLVIPSSDSAKIIAKFGEFLKFIAKDSEKYLDITQYIPVAEAMTFLEQTELTKSPRKRKRPARYEDDDEEEE